MQTLQLEHPDPDWCFIRQALSLSLLKNRPIAITRGAALLEGRADFRAVFNDTADALAALGAGRPMVEGKALVYAPRPPLPGRYRLDSGPFSSSTELLLLLMPALFHADFRSVLELSGVTHSPLSLPTACIKESLLAFLERLGFFGSLNLIRFGFHGSGGGFMESRIYPHERRDATLPLPETVTLTGIRIFIARLSTELAEIEKEMLSGLLGIDRGRVSIIEVMECDGPGNSIQIFAEWNGIRLVLSREMKLYGDEGDPGLGEDAIRHEIETLAGEARTVIEKRTLPVGLARELYPYLVLSGIDSSAFGKSTALGPTGHLCGILL